MRLGLVKGLTRGGPGDGRVVGTAPGEHARITEHGAFASGEGDLVHVQARGERGVFLRGSVRELLT